MVCAKTRPQRDSTEVPVPPLLSPRGEHRLGMESIMPGIDFDVLRREITMQQIVDLLPFQPSSRSRDRLSGSCPIHGSSPERSRSFSVNLTKGRYCCFACYSRGNPLELWTAVHRTTIYEAAITLCNTTGREIPWIHRW